MNKSLLPSPLRYVEPCTLLLILVFLAGLFHPAAAAAVDINEDRQISLETGHSFLLRTDAPIIRASVAKPSIADVTVLTPTQVLIVAKAKNGGSTTLILWEKEDRAVTLRVNVYAAIPAWILTALKDRIRELAPGVEITVSPGATTPADEQKIILAGSVPSMAALNQVLTIVKSFNLEFYNLIRVEGSQQVQLKVVMAEVSKSGLKEMGLNFFSMANSLSVGIDKGNTFNLNNTDKDGQATNSVSLTGGLGSPFGTAFNIALASTKNNLGSILSLLKSQGLSRTLATPTLVTMNGQKASFTVGGSYPVPVQGDSGSITIEDQDYGIKLEFTPYIVSEDDITLEVAPEVSAPDYSLGVSSSGTTVPGLTTRKVSSTLQLKAGQTFAMAGLLKEETYNTTDKVPFLGDLPLLGGLFTSKEVQHSQTELIVMVTPTIVRAMDRQEVPDLPGSSLNTRVSDTDFFLKNKTMGHLKPDSEPDTQTGFKGPTGFVK